MTISTFCKSLSTTWDAAGIQFTVPIGKPSVLVRQ